jgi:hypothetical protein
MPRGSDALANRSVILLSDSTKKRVLQTTL